MKQTRGYSFYFICRHSLSIWGKHLAPPAAGVGKHVNSSYEQPRVSHVTRAHLRPGNQVLWRCFVISPRMHNNVFHFLMQGKRKQRKCAQSAPCRSALKMHLFPPATLIFPTWYRSVIMRNPNSHRRNLSVRGYKCL